MRAILIVLSLVIFGCDLPQGNPRTEAPASPSSKGSEVSVPLELNWLEKTRAGDGQVQVATLARTKDWVFLDPVHVSPWSLLTLNSYQGEKISAVLASHQGFLRGRMVRDSAWLEKKYNRELHRWEIEVGHYIDANYLSVPELEQCVTLRIETDSGKSAHLVLKFNTWNPSSEQSY